MSQYHKIDSVFLRDPENKHKTFLMGEWARPEFGYLADLPWRGTEKIDGTNIRIYGEQCAMVDGTACEDETHHIDRLKGRTDKAQLPAKLVPVLIDIRYRLLASDLPDETVLYGEGYGAGIQSGGNYRQDQSFVLFDVKIGEQWQPWENVVAIGDKLRIAVVPTLGVMPLLDWVEAIGQAARGGDPLDQPHMDLTQSILHPGAPNEGVVLRPMMELADRRGQRIITKLKFKDFSEPLETRVKNAGM